MRISRRKALEIVDRLAGDRELSERSRYVAARQLQDRLDGKRTDRTQHTAEYEAYDTVRRHRSVTRIV